LTDLRLDAENDLVKIQWSGEPNDQNWSGLRDFWNSFSVDSRSPSLIVVSLGEFYSKRFWFQTYWLDLGLPLETGDGLLDAVSRADEMVAQFSELSQSGYLSPLAVGAEIDKLDFKRSLTQAQLVNIASMLRSANGANFSVPGAGKTATQLAIFSLLKSRNNLSRVLVICPKSSFEAWLEEPALIFFEPPSVEIFDGILPNPNVEILITNFEKIENDARLSMLKTWLTQEGGSGLVIDEAHRIKGGPRGVRWRSCMTLSAYSKRVDLLTGTPMPQGYEDLRNLLSVSWKIVPRHQLDDTRLSQLSPGGIFVRTTKSQLGLPEVKIKRIKLPLGPIQKEIYSALGRKYIGTLALNSQDQASLAKKGRAVFSLIAAATNPALVGSRSREELVKGLDWPPKELSGTSFMAALNSYMQHEIPPKYEWVTRYLARASLEGKKTLVWSSFVGNLELMSKYLSPHNPAVIHGSISIEDRQLELERFRHDPNCSVLITNPQTLGEGISLHKTAHEAIFVDRTYNAAQYLQALDRIHRLGLSQSDVTRIYLLETEGSIDERVAWRLEQKILTLSEMLNDEGLVKVSLPALEELDGVSDTLGLDNVDLDDLLAHLKRL
jgi:SNF2 family DNA or RNA helicase